MTSDRIDQCVGVACVTERLNRRRVASTEALGKRVAQARSAYKWTQDDLAKRSGVKKEQIAAVEAGKPVNVLVLLDLAKALDVTLDWFMHVSYRGDKPARPWDKAIEVLEKTAWRDRT